MQKTSKNLGLPGTHLPKLRGTTGFLVDPKDFTHVTGFTYGKHGFPVRMVYFHGVFFGTFFA